MDPKSDGDSVRMRKGFRDVVLVAFHCLNIYLFSTWKSEWTPIVGYGSYDTIEFLLRLRKVTSIRYNASKTCVVHLTVSAQKRSSRTNIYGWTWFGTKPDGDWLEEGYSILLNHNVIDLPHDWRLPVPKTRPTLLKNNNSLPISFPVLVVTSYHLTATFVVSWRKVNSSSLKNLNENLPVDRVPTSMKHTVLDVKK